MGKTILLVLTIAITAAMIVGCVGVNSDKNSDLYLCKNHDPVNLDDYFDEDAPLVSKDKFSLITGDMTLAEMTEILGKPHEMVGSGHYCGAIWNADDGVAMYASIIMDEEYLKLTANFDCLYESWMYEFTKAPHRIPTVCETYEVTDKPETEKDTEVGPPIVPSIPLETVPKN